MRLDESIKKRSETITIRVPTLLIDRLDKAVQDGIYRNRSDGCRTALARDLSIIQPNREEHIERVKQYLSRPIPGSSYAAALAGLLNSAVDILTDAIPELLDQESTAPKDQKYDHSVRDMMDRQLTKNIL